MSINNKFDAEKARANMVEQMIRPWNVLNQRVLDTYYNVSRDIFVPEEYQTVAFSEMCIPLNSSVSMLPANIEARMFQEMRIKEYESVLIVGTGSGFTTACASRLGKSVTSIDIDDSLVERAKKITDQLGYDNIEYRVLDITKADEGFGRFDLIMLMGSVKVLPEALFNLLNINGRIGAVVGEQNDMSFEVYYNYAGKVQKKSFFEASIERLVGFEDKPSFVF